jgi:micrococcal nuclease
MTEVIASSFKQKTGRNSDSQADGVILRPENRFHRSLVRRLLCFVSLGLVVLVGCHDTLMAIREVPAPLGENTDYELVGLVYRNWGGDSFEVRAALELHCISLRGVDTPKPGQPYFGKSVKAFRSMVNRQKIRIHVVDRDEFTVELADAFVANENPANNPGDLNLALELIRNGFGWYDGTEFEGSEIYREAEQTARQNKFGIWSQDNPIPPWEFEEQKQRDAGSKLKL